MSKEKRIKFPWIFVIVIIIVIIGFIFYRDNTLSNSSQITPTITPSIALTPTTANEISWSEASDFIGEYKSVCGVVVEVSVDRNSGGIFLNMGYKYPNKNRFSIVFWSDAQVEGREESDLIQLTDEYICVSGVISTYQDVTEIEAKPSSPITIGY